MLFLPVAGDYEYESLTEKERFRGATGTKAQRNRFLGV
jgi:hypothetical protein